MNDCNLLSCDYIKQCALFLAILCSSDCVKHSGLYRLCFIFHATCASMNEGPGICKGLVP